MIFSCPDGYGDEVCGFEADDDTDYYHIKNSVTTVNNAADTSYI